MSKYIDREELIRNIISDMALFMGTPDDVQKHDEQCNRAISYIESATGADVVPVVHGRWIEREDPMLDTYYTCSACNEDFYIEQTGDPVKDLFTYTYCPNCGAKMDMKDGGDNDAVD